MNPNLSESKASKQAGVFTPVGLGPRAAGFSLLELMLVLAILGVLATIAVPSYSENINKQAVRNAAQTLLAHMKQARTRALSENRTVAIKFGVDMDGNAANAYVFDAGTTGIERKVMVMYGSFSKHLLLSKNNPAQKPNTLNFKSQGTVGASSIYFCSGGHSKRITLNGLGRAYLCDANSTSTACTKAYVCL